MKQLEASRVDTTVLVVQSLPNQFQVWGQVDSKSQGRTLADVVLLMTQKLQQQRKEIEGPIGCCDNSMGRITSGALGLGI